MASRCPWRTERSGSLLETMTASTSGRSMTSKLSPEANSAPPCLATDLRKGFDSLLADRQGPEGPRVQDVDRPAHVERLSQPLWARRPRVQMKSGRLVSRSERLNGIVRDR